MIKFFRKIRRRLLTEDPSSARTDARRFSDGKGPRQRGIGKFGRYLLYAIGEIILVVIGILIALQINNANEKRKQKETINAIYSMIAEDLQNDVRDINIMVTHFDSLESIFVRVLEGSFTKQDYETCKECLRIILGFPDLSLELRGYELLNNFNGISILEQDSLQITITQFYSKHLFELEIDNNSRIMDLDNNYMYWKNNYAWWSDLYLGKNAPAFIEYAVESADYKNRVATFYGDTYHVYLPNIKAFMTGGNAIIDAINKRNNLNK